MKIEMPADVGSQEEAQHRYAEIERLRDFAELSSDWFWEQDAQLRFSHFSGIHVARIARSPDSVIGLTRWELPIRVPQMELEAHIAACRRHEAFQDFEYDIASADGSYQRFSVSGKPVFDGDGNFCGYRGIGRNITVLHRARQALRRHEQQLLQIIENSPVAVFVIDETHRITHWNRACEHLTGIRATEVVGTRDAWRGFYETERPTLCNLVLDSADDAKISSYYGRQHTPSSVIPGGHEAEMFFPQNAYRKTCWLFFTAAPIFDSLGNKTGAIETLQDVTDRHRATEALERLAEEYAQIFDNALVGIAFMRERIFLRCNRRVEELFGFPPDGMLGKTSRILFPSEEEWIAAGLHFEQTAREQGSCTDERHYQRTDGSLIRVQVNGRKVRLYSDDYWVWCFQDVTGQRQAEERLIESHAELESRVAERTAALSQQIHFMQELIETIPGPLFYKSRGGAYLGCNQAFADFLGKRREDIIGHTSHDLAPRHLAEIYRAADEMLYASGGHQIYETKVRSAGGRESDVMFHKAIFHDQEGAQGGLIGVMLDISERVSMEARLRQAANVFNSTADGVAITDSEGRIVAVNPAFTRITGHEENEVIGLDHRQLHLGEDKQLEQAIASALVQDGVWRGELWSKRKDGGLFAEQLTISSVREKGGNISHYVEVFSDVTLLKRTQERLNYQAHHDTLTGLPNRMLFEQLFEKTLQRARRENTFVALLFIDLDRFKSINDCYGHDVGDLVLIEMGRRLRSVLRESDTVARLGGDEFIVLLEGLESASAASRIAGKIAECADEIIYAAGCECRIGASVGISLYPDDGDCFAGMMKAADAAMYRVKRQH